MAARFDPVIHPPPRLQICARLAAVQTMDFATLRQMLDVSESVLSKHIRTLEDAGYVAVSKATSDGRQRTWLSLTGAGRKAFAGHAQALRALVGEQDLAAE